MGVARFERFFRAAAGLDVDRDDLKRYSDFVAEKTYDLLIVGQATATANGRDVIEPNDLPITRGLRERIREFERMDDEIELAPILEHFVAHPAMMTLGEETEARLPAVIGGLSIGLARTFRVIDPRLRNPQTRHWERAFQVFDLLL